MEGGWVKALLEAHGLRAKKARGQHFLSDRAVAARIADAIAPVRSDLVFEVGPGLGSLTLPLCEQAGRVVAVEIDQDFEPVLQERLADFSNVHIRWEDARKTPWGQVADEESREIDAPQVAVKLAGNLPYGLTGPLLGAILGTGALFEQVVVMVQREVADRMAAAPVGKEYGFFSVFVQSHAFVDRLFLVPPGAFWPPPKVESAVVRLRPTPWPDGAPARERMLKLARHAFAQRRKTLSNALSAGTSLPKARVQALLQQAGVDGGRRAETLTLQEFATLAKVWP